MLLWILIGAAASYLAYQRGRDPYIWFALGIFLGILAVLALVLLPPIQSQEEIEADQKNQEIIKLREKQVQEQEKIENSPDLQPQSIQTKEWFYLDKSRQQQGPYSFYIISELWENGDITAHSYMWSNGMPDWRRVHDIPELFNALEQIDSENKKAFPEDL
jgi:hypothetical protein